MTDEQTFCFDNEMIETALIANGWSRGWNSKMWVPDDENPDWSSYSKKEAFIKLLCKCNLISKNVKGGYND